ncbi:odorant receptor 131-2-like [Pelodytes ibericus]
MNSSLVNSSLVYQSPPSLSLYSLQVTQSVRYFLLSLMFISFFYFLYFISMILTVFFTTVHLRENPRYILFAHMLINDAVYLTLGIFLSVTTTYIPVYIPVPICYILVVILSTSFRVTPYNLAAMALERYVAICFPLRHGELCTRQKSGLAIAVIWAVGMVPNVADLAVMLYYEDPKFYSLSFRCSRAIFVKTEAQRVMRDATHVLVFLVVGLVIIYTYIRIMVVAASIESGKSSAFKASKTVMLHAFQLLLCMAAFSYNIIELYFKEYIGFIAQVNFFFFMCLPRSLSPLIYGLRDEILRNYIKRFLLCSAFKVTPNTK